MGINWIATLMYECKECNNKDESLAKTMVNTIVMSGCYYVAFLSQKRQGFESDQTRLKVYDSRTGKVFSLSEDYDISFEEIAWDTDEKGVFFTTHRRGYLALGYISLQKKEIEYLVEDMSVTGLTVGPNNVFYKASRLDSLPEIYRNEKTTRKRIQVTSFNQKQQQKWIFGKVQSTKVTTGHPSTHGFIVLPPGYNSYHQYPLLVLLHGGPQTHGQISGIIDGMHKCLPRRDTS